MNAVRPGLAEPLIGLLGARWGLGAPVVGATWFASGERVAFGLADGTVAIAPAVWEGAAHVRPREAGGMELVPATALPPPVVRIGVHEGPCLALAAGEVVSGGADGRLAAISADGEVTTLASFPGQRIAHVAGARAFAVGARVYWGDDTVEAPGVVTALAPDALAIGFAGGVTLGAGERLEVAGTPRALAWSPDGALLVAALTDAAQVWRPTGGAAWALEGYAGAPLSLSFSVPGGFLATSGSAQVVCWWFDGAEPRRAECGVGGTQPVSRVACHPSRPLIAAGYARGAVLLCQPGSADILFVREAGGGAVSALAWSPDGTSLALGLEGGEIGVVSFPESLFRGAAKGGQQ